MIKRSLILASVISANAFASNPSDNIEFSVTQRDDIDSQTTSSGIGFTLITRAGLFACDYTQVSGETRIDSFNNIFGISSIQNNPWLNYSADKQGCKYGLKLPLAGGTVKAGIGYQDYAGETALIAGGKSIHMVGKGLNASYEKGIHTFELKHTRKHGDVFARFTTYDNSVGINETVTRLAYLQPGWRVQLEDTRGDKTDLFSTALFPTNRYNYAYQTLEIGKIVPIAEQQHWYIAPVLINGSKNGTFNPLQNKNSLHGLHLEYQAQDKLYSFRMTDFEGDGERPYSPPSNENLYENRQSRSYQLQVKNKQWSVSVENSHHQHLGRINISNTPYTSIVGGAALYNNLRIEDKWQTEIEYQFSKALSIALSYYRTAFSDRQYNYALHQYREDGTQLNLQVNF